MFFARKLQLFFTFGAIGAISLSLAPRPADAQTLSGENNPHRVKLTLSDRREAELQRARRQTLAILQADNACSAWFREADADAAHVFESARYEIVKNNPRYIFRMSIAYGNPLYKHPWAAKAYESSGRNSIIQLNANGPFFNTFSPVLVLDSGGMPTRVDGTHRLTIASFSGDSPKAQVTTLLHELGHIIGRIPEDDDSWDGRSVQNTKEVLRNCKKEIQEYAQETILEEPHSRKIASREESQRKPTLVSSLTN